MSRLGTSAGYFMALNHAFYGCCAGYDIDMVHHALSTQISLDIFSVIYLFPISSPTGSLFSDTDSPADKFQRIRDALNSARADHTSAVTSRIDSVNQLKDVVPLTEQLYAVARETNSLEHENFILSQEAAVKSEVKAVLDSWVRHEQQQREAEQVALVESVRASIEAELGKPAFRGRLLEEALAQVERE